MSQVFSVTPQKTALVNFSCPLCNGTRADYMFHARGFRVFRCTGCTLTFSDHFFQKSTNETPSNQPAKNGLALDAVERTEKDHAGLIAALNRLGAESPVLVFSDVDDEVVRLLGRRGIAFTRIFDAKGIGKLSAERKFTAVIVSDAIMRDANPRATLDKIRQYLPAGGPIILSIPLLDGQQARLMGRNWHEWRSPNLWFFTRETLSLILLAAGFERIWFQPVRRQYSLDHLNERLHLAREGRLWLRALRMLHGIFPKRLRNSAFPLPSGTAVITAAAAPPTAGTVLSIVVPVFNEHQTFKEMFDALLAKQLPGLRKEIIVVESNSTDGSRDLVRAYENHPDVRVIYQPAPRGKGSAVREGLKAATGDILMIQDADLEYDLNDYDNLLAPLLAHQSMFVLGSRHQGEWKIREFTDAPITAAVFNLGHSFFRTLINIVLRTKMADPFTMFKVFRRDALFGLDFVCNRFDLDIELVIKLVRKGYAPLEIPVNYVSRSFAEGKKVSVTRDGMTWVLTILRARFSPLGNGET